MTITSYFRNEHILPARNSDALRNIYTSEFWLIFFAQNQLLIDWYTIVTDNRRKPLNKQIHEAHFFWSVLQVLHHYVKCMLDQAAPYLQNKDFVDFENS